MQRPLRLRARAAPRPLKSHTLTLLRPPFNMEVIPHLGDLRAPGVRRARARGRFVVARAGAADVRRGAVLGREGGFEGGQRVFRAVGGRDAVRGEPGEGRQAGVVHDRRGEEVDDFLVFDVRGAVAGDVEGGEAGGVLGELVLLVCELRFVFSL